MIFSVALHLQYHEPSYSWNDGGGKTKGSKLFTENHYIKVVEKKERGSQRIPLLGTTFVCCNSILCQFIHQMLRYFTGWELWCNAKAIRYPLEPQIFQWAPADWIWIHHNFDKFYHLNSIMQHWNGFSSYPWCLPTLLMSSFQPLESVKLIALVLSVLIFHHIPPYWPNKK